MNAAAPQVFVVAFLTVVDGAWKVPHRTPKDYSDLASADRAAKRQNAGRVCYRAMTIEAFSAARAA